MNKAKHTNITFTTETNLPNHVNNTHFKTFDELCDGMYEVEKNKKKVVLDTPIQIGVTIYSYAKLSVINFGELLNKYLVNDLYQIMECDTDSLYIAFAQETIDECVKKEYEEEWKHVKWDYFPLRMKQRWSLRDTKKRKNSKTNVHLENTNPNILVWE